MTAPAIRVEKLSKAYQIGARSQGEYRTLRESLIEAAARPLRHFRRRQTAADRKADWRTHWALEDVSFEVQSGQVVGIIGGNGAGKSTLLKILSRIAEPTSGRCEVRGRLGSLLEVGTGFHPELTGRENIYLNGSFLGMSRREIVHKFDEIVAFSGIGKFLDTPVKRYSSGMYVRLAFAVAAHLEPEILLVDEVLSVGDAAFQKKCLGKMEEVSRSGRTVLLVSHNMGNIVHLCKNTIFLKAGRLLYSGDSETGIECYLKSLVSLSGCTIDLTAHPNRHAGCKPIIRSVSLFNSSGDLSDRFVCGESIRIDTLIDPEVAGRKLNVALVVEDSSGNRLFTLATFLSRSGPVFLEKLSRVECHLDQLPLPPGRYYISLHAGPLHESMADYIERAVGFDVTETDYYGSGLAPNASRGSFVVRSEWRMSEIL